MPVLRTRAVNWMELLAIAGVLIIVAALTVPRFSRAATPATQSPLKQRLQVLRNAIERYRFDHLALPGEKTDGAHPARTAEAFISQLTACTDADGRTSPTPSERFCYGPYLRHGMQDCPVGPHAGSDTVAVISGDDPPAVLPDRDAAWIYNVTTGWIWANTTETDRDGRPYCEY